MDLTPELKAEMGVEISDLVGKLIEEKQLVESIRKSGRVKGDIQDNLPFCKSRLIDALEEYFAINNQFPEWLKKDMFEEYGVKGPIDYTDTHYVEIIEEGLRRWAYGFDSTQRVPDFSMWGADNIIGFKRMVTEISLRNLQLALFSGQYSAALRYHSYLLHGTSTEKVMPDIFTNYILEILCPKLDELCKDPNNKTPLTLANKAEFIASIGLLVDTTRLKSTSPDNYQKIVGKLEQYARGLPEGINPLQLTSGMPSLDKQSPAQ